MKEIEFIKELKEKRELRSMKIAKNKVDIFWEGIVDVLKTNEKLEFKGWGKFEVKETKERIFSNPRTKKIEKIPAQKKITFKQGKNLKRSFNTKVKE
ncbi:MAG: HU family DNA-binding protein [Fusobacterium varium]|jgi:DNA-binding protein HU-beta|uniref:HU family DNA-binding protein n=1 Tax=Fusobacterium varium ATCC 27725 TaxID=469618 RepID=A0ABN5JKX7_FUSVA|nr:MULTISPECIES: HU family DNA-binding protein [Fusobacterium]AVQ31924.1 HU family DNA-binding protein [Fusobacterium varium ATCC 27725]EES63277.1 putative DNA-binding protein HU 1 [Fusobacterium varium ATCC 27725]MCF2672510.1 HU family DNA-binding protein [Fusobacterium varium]MDY4005973.1 HU family DNA-binding protein [Fusobacterium varium]OFL85795.1 methionine ABC transporter ATP-binding protein [Fusobacterium sp. HMSC073F01]